MAVTLPDKSYHGHRAQEEAWLALPEEQQPRLVVFFGWMGYEVLAVCDTKAEADELLALWSICATFGSLAKGKADLGMRVPGWTRHASPHDFDVRTPADLDHLTKAIIGSYR